MWVVGYGKRTDVRGSPVYRRTMTEEEMKARSKVFALRIVRLVEALPQTRTADVLGRQLLRAVVREFKAAGKTVLVVSHVLPEVEELCDAVAVLVAGKVVHTGTVAALVRDPHTGEKRSLEAALKSLYEKGQAA